METKTLLEATDALVKVYREQGAAAAEDAYRKIGGRLVMVEAIALKAAFHAAIEKPQP